MPRPLTHWKSLWFGILILAFIIWAWLRSTTHEDSLVFSHGTTIRIVASSDGSLIFSNYSLPGTTPTEWQFESIPFPPDQQKRYFPPPFYRLQYGEENAYFLAWWLIALTFLLPWTTLLTWCHHRIKRLALRSGDNPVAPAS